MVMAKLTSLIEAYFVSLVVQMPIPAEILLLKMFLVKGFRKGGDSWNAPDSVAA